MDNKKLSEKKQELMKPDWTENLHHELQELPLQEAKWIVENMTDSEIFSKVNNRRFQEDYIADYIEYLWTISPIAYWKHIIASLSPNIGALWSDNMSHFRKMCTIKIPVDVLHAVLSFAISHDDKNRQHRLQRDDKIAQHFYALLSCHYCAGPCFVMKPAFLRNASSS